MELVKTERVQWQQVFMYLMAMAVLAMGLAEDLSAEQGPIHLIFDVHIDPTFNEASFPGKIDMYQKRIENINWVLDQVDPLGVKISFLSSGWWPELVVDEGPLGTGAECLRRLHANGGQIGSHSHTEWRAGPFDWPSFVHGDPDLSHSRQVWLDNMSWVNAAIQTALGPKTPAELLAINCVRGSHMPKDEADYHLLMQEFAFAIREGGPEEDYYQFYGHHIWHPFRPAVSNYMAEDLNGPFAVPPQGPVIGRAMPHHDVFQDMTAPHVKRQFLQLYINWRYRDRLDLPEKVWCWGWAGHAHDFDPESVSRTDLLEVVHWLTDHFAGRLTPDGRAVMTWSTQKEAAGAYVAWEAAHPGESSFSFDVWEVDWVTYPWLRPVAQRMRDFGWVTDLTLGTGVEAYHLRRDTTNAVLLWRDDGTSVENLRPALGPEVSVIGLETGNVYGTGIDPSSVAVGLEPLWVVEPYCGDEEHLPPLGDLDNSCHVNLVDFGLFVGQWLVCTAPVCD